MNRFQINYLAVSLRLSPLGVKLLSFSDRRKRLRVGQREKGYWERFLENFPRNMRRGEHGFLSREVLFSKRSVFYMYRCNVGINDGPLRLSSA